MPRSSTQFSVQEFVTFVNEMEENQLFAHFYKHPTEELVYIQLPNGVSKAFSGLERNVDHYMLTKTFLRRFCDELQSAVSRDYHSKLASVETQHAKQLFAFLVYKDITVVKDDEIYSFKEQARQGKFHDLQHDAYKWLNKHNAPHLKSFENLLLRFINKTIEAQNREKAHQEKIQQDAMQTLSNYLTYTFEYNTLNLEALSHAIDGYISQNSIELFSNNTASFRPMLADETSSLLNNFKNFAQYKGLYVLTQDEVFEAFIKMINSLLHFSSFANPHQLASQKLVGFMMYHNFQIEYQEHRFRFSELLTLGNVGLHISQEWLSQQEYPNKAELENAINMKQDQKRSFLTNFSRSHLHSMDVEEYCEPMDIEQKSGFRGLFTC